MTHNEGCMERPASGYPSGLPAALVRDVPAAGDDGKQ